MSLFYHKKRVLFIVKERQVYGTKTRCYGLFNSCNFVANKLNEIGYVAKTIQVVDNNCIDKEVRDFNPDYCFIEALWVVPEKFEILSKLHPKVTWNIRIHSAAPFLATEGISVEWLRKYISLRKKDVKIDVSANHKPCVDDLRVFIPDTYYLPNIYYPIHNNKEYDFPLFSKQDNEIHIGCFGALRPLKNHLKQALVAIKFAEKLGKKLYFYINKSEHENQTTSSVLKNLEHLFDHFDKHTLVPISWHEHHNFIEIVKQMDLGLQLSFTETFNIVAADFVSNNVPIITSKSIDWVSAEYQADLDLDDDILNKMMKAYETKHCKIDVEHLQKYNDSTLKFWTSYLK